MQKEQDIAYINWRQGNRMPLSDEQIEKLAQEYLCFMHKIELRHLILRRKTEGSKIIFKG